MLRKKGLKRTQPRRECKDCGASVSDSSKTGRCRSCACAAVGRANAMSHPTCEFCGNPCPTTGRKYCSRECYDKGHVTPKGSEHHSWAGDNVGYWGARRRTQKLVTAGECESCGAPNADRHHKDRDFLNNAADNIAFLCRSCHSRPHYIEDGPKGAVAESIRRRGSA